MVRFVIKKNDNTRASTDELKKTGNLKENTKRKKSKIGITILNFTFNKI